MYNNTRVIQARLVFHKGTGARIEVFCLDPLHPNDYQLSLGSTEGCTWRCMVGNLKKWKSGVLTMTATAADGKSVTLSAEHVATLGNTHEVRFSWDDPSRSFGEVLELMGQLPIPPYLNRETEESDKTTYQTVYSRIEGSVAAPTAGLHFTTEVLDGLRQDGVKMTEVTLHVGAGTFQPVKTEDANLHPMHTEFISVSRQSLVDLRDNIGHIVAVGTTSMRTLESLYYLGESLGEHVEQFEPYNRPHTLSSAESLQRLIDHLDKTGATALHASTAVMIEPGYQFRMVDQLITNFHQPKSTLLLLVSAFVGRAADGHEYWKDIYHYAMDNGFRFLSYGDSSILTRSELNK